MPITLDLVSVQAESDILLIIIKGAPMRQIIVGIVFVVSKPDDPEIVHVFHGDAICMKNDSRFFVSAER